MTEWRRDRELGVLCRRGGREIAMDERDEVNSSELEQAAEPRDEAAGQTAWHRRTFLKAVALGAAATALIGKDGEGFHFGPSVALANDLSTSPCTAEDVQIIGPGIVVNEPCNRSGGNTFPAKVQFTVRNNTSTGRYCVALHLIATTVNGVRLNPGDLILRDASGSSTAPGKSGGESFRDTVMFATIPNFPCNAGLVCFGSAGVTRGKCAPNTCTTIAWNTSPNAAGCTTADQSPPGGQCRHQQVCVQGFGATLACTANCTPTCGGTATLRACVSAGANEGPFTYLLTGTDGSSQSFGPTSDRCHDFQVKVTQNTTYTVKISRGDSCFRTASVSLNASPISVALALTGNTNCDGVLTFTANVTGGNGCSFEWKVDGAVVSGVTGNVLTYQPRLDGANHIVSVTANCGGCTATASKTVKQCVTTTVVA